MFQERLCIFCVNFTWHKAHTFSGTMEWFMQNQLESRVLPSIIKRQHLLPERNIEQLL